MPWSYLTDFLTIDPFIPKQEFTAADICSGNVLAVVRDERLITPHLANLSGVVIFAGEGASRLDGPVSIYYESDITEALIHTYIHRILPLHEQTISNSIHLNKYKQQTKRLKADLSRIHKDYEHASHTLQKQAQAELQTKNELMASTFCSTSVGGWIYDMRSQYFECTTFVRDFFFLSDIEVFEPNFLTNAIDDFHQGLVTESYSKLYESGTPFSINVKVKRSKNELIWARLTGDAIRGVHGEIEKITGSVQDISQIKGLEMQLLQSHKLDVIGTLAGGIAHDFNNKLGTIRLVTGLLEKQITSDQPELSKMVNQISKSTESASKLTNQLLAYSQKQVMDPRQVHLDQIVLESSEILERILGPDIQLELELESNEKSVFIDPAQFDQVLWNLCQNAKDAMVSGGVLRISTTDNIPRDGKRYVRVSISDTGPGICEEDLKRIFDPFFTTKKIEKGTGLGLSTAVGIVEQSRGFLEVCSSLGKGSTFSVYLPTYSEGISGFSTAC